MKTVSETWAYYKNALELPKSWNWSRKHFRIVLRNHRFLKLNKFRSRIDAQDLRYFCLKYMPLHVYFSVLDWLFPERVGKKHKANYAFPIGGEYVIDVDSHNLLSENFLEDHNHVKERPICFECLYKSKLLTMHICEAIEENYRRIEIVFSGRKGFHIHVLDFKLRDWTYYNERNPIKSHEVARFKYSKNLATRCDGFDRSHFRVASDPMRIISVPYSLNAVSGVICLPIGSRKSLEKMSVQNLVRNANGFMNAIGVRKALDLFQAHPEPADVTIQSYPGRGR